MVYAFLISVSGAFVVGLFFVQCKRIVRYYPQESMHMLEIYHHCFAELFYQRNFMKVLLCKLILNELGLNNSEKYSL